MTHRTPAAKNPARHGGFRVNARHGGRFHFLRKPLHASWVNQIEVWFRILHRRGLEDADSAEVGELVSALTGFVARWNKRKAHPFRRTLRSLLEKHRGHAAPKSRENAA